MEKTALRKLFLLLSTGLIITGCTTDTVDAPEETDTPETAEVEETDTTAEDSTEVTATIDILIDGEAVADLSEEVTVEEGTYLLDVMYELYDIDASEAGFISRIEDYEQDLDAERYWLSYMDGEMLPVGAAEYELEDGDSIEWRLEDSDY